LNIILSLLAGAEVVLNFVIEWITVLVNTMLQGSEESIDSVIATDTSLQLSDVVYAASGSSND